MEIIYAYYDSRVLRVERKAIIRCYHFICFDTALCDRRRQERTLTRRRLLPRFPTDGSTVTSRRSRRPRRIRVSCPRGDELLSWPRGDELLSGPRGNDELLSWPRGKDRAALAVGERRRHPRGNRVGRVFDKRRRLVMWYAEWVVMW